MITAAAAIMVAVFAAFVPSSDIFLKIIGIGLATAILVDATVVRMLLVPAVMQLLGRRAWWLPSWLDRRLPQLHVEGVGLGDGRRDGIEAPVPLPTPRRSKPLEPTRARADLRPPIRFGALTDSSPRISVADSSRRPR